MLDTKAAARVKLCRECLGLRGPWFDTFNRCERVQRCVCEPEEARWNAYDYNTAFELCHCCAAATVSSGSRWSPFFCAACKPRVLAYNDAAGIAVIPIGRHSTMNQITLRATDAHLAAARAAFAAGLENLFGRYTNDVWTTFPWPQEPSEPEVVAVADAARALRATRASLMQGNSWSLRQLYQAAEIHGPHPLKDAQAALDAAVRAAYGHPGDLEATEFLLDLNKIVAQDEAEGRSVQGPGVPAGLDPRDARWMSEDCIEPPSV